ncbi:MAG TPA: ImmA/IrrE family metallo-endopeptidase [Candidatus Baltobacteraceae bacterium]|nr:ImmA/IrrE family metallo-endopeptidase [Candidatus Baltobacteraceae bacterium]
MHELAPFAPRVAANFLNIPVVSFAQITGCDQALDVLRRAGRAVSGLTLFVGSRRIIVYNDAHSDGRVNNTIAHELAHALLSHIPSAPLGTQGCRSINRDVEDEADYLAGVLLLPDAACVNCARLSLTLDHISLKYGVSRQLASYRLNITGARARAARSMANATRQPRWARGA